jgi:hypothetical protein
MPKPLVTVVHAQEVVRSSKKALLLRIGGTCHWIPRSAISNALYPDMRFTVRTRVLLAALALPIDPAASTNYKPNAV